MLFIIIAYAFLSLVLSKDMLILNQALSFLLFFPAIVFLVFNKSFFEVLDDRRIDRALLAFCYLLLLNGSIGVVQYLINPGDDAAIGFYGRSGLQMHGLAILYVFASLYFYANSAIKHHKIKSALALFFMLTCFYGAGVIAIFVAVFISVLIGTKKKLKVFFVLSFFVLLFITVGFFVRPGTMLYNYNSAILFLNSLVDIVSGTGYSTFGMPRKLVAWLNYFEAIKTTPSSILFGFGGGSFNSRAAFLLNGEYSSLSFLPYSVSQWHDGYIKPLWSGYILSQQYQDGTMNQPFSSALSVLSEYGFIGLIFVCGLFGRLRSYLIEHAKFKEDGSIRVLLMNIVFFYFIALCLIDNILEYAEIVVPFFILLFFLPRIGTFKKKQIGGIVKAK